MHGPLDFLLYLLAFGMLMFMLLGLGVIGFFWDNKFKIIATVIGSIFAYLFYKKQKQPIENGKCDKVVNDNPFEKRVNEIKEVKNIKE